jgi:hypothetical protein
MIGTCPLANRRNEFSSPRRLIITTASPLIGGPNAVDSAGYGFV